MITIRPATQRGTSNLGWLDSHHTFSFGEYYDPKHMSFKTLRVINEDWLTPGTGFGTHPHRDMEIITYVVQGTIAHRDSMGNVEHLQAGELQRMTAGTGLTHSEYNGSETDPLHLYQIWIMPDRKGHTPGYEQHIFDPKERRNRWQLVVRPLEGATLEEASNGALTLHQQARIYLTDIDPGQKLGFTPGARRGVWVQVIRGSVNVNGTALNASDGAAIENEQSLTFSVDGTATEPAHVMLFELND